MDGTDEGMKRAMLTVCNISAEVHRALRVPAARRGAARVRNMLSKAAGRLLPSA